MATLVYDIETNGLLDQLDRVHSLVIGNPETGELWSCADQPGYTPIKDGLQMLEQAEFIVGHNVIKFDEPALKKVYPWWQPQGTTRDTLVLSRLIWPEIKGNDFEFRKKQNQFPGRLIGSHSLEAWGWRLREYKGDFGHDTHSSKDGSEWAQWSKEMQDYCEQDVRVTMKLWRRILAKKPADLAVWIEHRFQEIIFEMERNGFPFDVSGAASLYGELAQEREKLDQELAEAFPPWWKPTGTQTPKRTMRRFRENPHGALQVWSKGEQRWKTGYYESLTKGRPFTRVKLQEFDAGSGEIIADRLIHVHGWQPTEFTSEDWPMGPYEQKPQTSEDELNKLSCEPAKKIVRHMMLSKRIGQIAEGKQAWLKLEQNGRIHGTVITNGAVTGRCTHRNPNMAQVPATKNPYGKECRSLFHAPPGYKLVGVDADSLELVGLAHYMARWDDGEFAKAVAEGDKSQGTDPHTMNQKAAGLSTRDAAKTFIYALVYGAGDWKIGLIVKPEGTDAQKRQAGKDLKKKFFAGMPALGKLLDAVKAKVKKAGKLQGLDGRTLPIRSPHSALNTLIQSCGAVVVKLATILFYDMASARGYVPGKDFVLAAHVHDEFQVLAREDIAQEIGELGKQAIEQAAERLGLRCFLTGSYDVGDNWAETH